jgi:hypothetical protein
MIESLLLAVTRVTTMLGERHLTNATGFFFARDDRLFLVTTRHVVLDEASDHHPDLLEIELHVAPDNVALTRQFLIPLYRDGKSIWREGRDSAGPIDVVALELERPALPETLLYHAFTHPPTSCGSSTRSRSERRCSSPAFRWAFTTRCIACRSHGRRSSRRRSGYGSRATGTS